MHRLSPRTSRGSVITIVLWSLAIAALVTSAVQISSYRQATLGRESLERIQARWAARSGIESTLAVMRWHHENPIPDDAFALPRDMEYVAVGDVAGASWDIRHHARGRDWYGPMDEHSRLNVNIANIAHLMMLDHMWLDIADAIVQWIKPEHDPTGMSVGREYYQSLQPPYEPRNDRVQNIAELELVAGVWPKYLRGEDWNLNNRLDVNEDNSGRSFPPDNGDGALNAGWSAFLTAYSVEGGATGSGEERIHLPWATIDQIMERLDVDERQAKALIRFGRKTDNRLEQLLIYPISNVDNNGDLTPAPFNEEVEPLTDAQLRMVFTELTMHDPLDRVPGRMNINTVPREWIVRLLEELFQLDQAIADELLYMRASRSEGITSIADFLEIPEIADQPDLLIALGELFCTYSNVYTISSRGRSLTTGLEVEIIATVDRSTLPIRILEYREQ